MRKVGIITKYDVRNYGNRLQAYALAKVLKNLGYQPVEVSYTKRFASFLTEIIKANRFLFGSYNFLLGVLKRKKSKTIQDTCKRLNIFMKFSDKVKKQVIRRDSKGFYCYVCGSDQIWNPHFAGQAKYFAAFAPRRKRLSYAASFGTATMLESKADAYRKHLSGMDHIAVREESGVPIVRELIGREAQVVLDPTLMLTGEEWKTLAKKPDFAVQDKFLVTYFLGEIAPETKAYIQELSQKHGLQVITLNKLEQNDFWHSTGPAEFIWLIEHAALVCTDSFHASVFSILLKSPFIVFNRGQQYGDMSSRFDTLLGKFNLTGRAFKNIVAGEEFSVDFGCVSQVLEAERARSLQYLTNALDSVEKKGSV